MSRALSPRLAKLLASPQSFDLFQAIRLIELQQGQLPRMGAQVSLAFPASDIAEVQAPAGGAGQSWTLRTPVLALAGAHGPLPMPVTEQLLARRWVRDSAGLDFLDIFHHRFLSFLYRARKKHHPALSAGDAGGLPLARAIDALAGLGHREGLHDTAGQGLWLRHAALLGAAPRSMANLENLLRDSLGWVVRGRQFVGGWQPLAEVDTPLLGRGAVLGENAMLGRRVWDAAAGISLALGPLPQQALPGLLPGGADLARLRWLVGRHLPSELQLSLELQPEPCPAQALPRLGAARLGWTSWLRPGLGRGEKRALPSIRLQLGSTSHPPERQPLPPRAVASA